MENNLNQPALTREEFKAQYDEFYSSLPDDEKVIMDQATWDTNGTTWEKGLLDFYDKNSDGSEDSQRNIKQYNDNLYSELSNARASGDVDRIKYLEVVMKMPMPLQNPPRQQAANDNASRLEKPFQEPEKARQEPEKLKVDYKEELRKVIDDLEYDLKKTIKEMKWENTDKKWEDGFLEFIKRDVMKSGKFGVTKFKDYVKDLKRGYEDTSESKDPEGKKAYKAQFKVAEKMLGIYTNEKTEKEKEMGKANEKLKGIWSWENIKFTLRNIRRQVFELVGVKDPFFDYAQMNKGMAEMEKKAGVQAASPVKDSNPSVYDQFLAKKQSGGGAGSPASGPAAASSGSDSEYKNAA